ncbi:MAG: carbon-nitrogen hydrolase family protein [Deltaproteobacteria bacterium]
MKIALVQMSSSDDPAYNLEQATDFIEEAATLGADFILTPEITNCVSGSRDLQRQIFRSENDDPTLIGLQAVALDTGRWLLIGSLGLLSGDPDGRFANRSFLISPEGAITARYDKIHMFDVDLGAGESFRESAAYRPGDQAVLADAPFAKIGMTICYDVRFPHLFRALAQAGAQIITVPAAFAVTTGRDHLETLLRARAIETGCYILAPAQCGTHPSSTGHKRQTWGHSLVIDPWGQVISDGGTEPGVVYADIDLSEVAAARARIPSLRHDRKFTGP